MRRFLAALIVLLFVACFPVGAMADCGAGGCNVAVRAGALKVAVRFQQRERKPAVEAIKSVRERKPLSTGTRWLFRVK